MRTLRYLWNDDGAERVFELVRVAGTNGHPYRFGDVRPIEVPDFFIATVPVTQALWVHVVGQDSPSIRRGAELPLENVSLERDHAAGRVSGAAQRTSRPDVGPGVSGKRRLSAAVGNRVGIRCQTASGKSVADSRLVLRPFPLPWSHCQISTLFYERTLASRNKAAMLRKGAKAQAGEDPRAVPTSLPQTSCGARETSTNGAIGSRRLVAPIAAGQ